MPTSDTPTRPNGASLAANGKSGKAVATVDSPAERIRQTEGLLRDLLLENDFGEDKILLARVENGLEQIQLKLSDLAGRQELYELWIGR